MNPPMGGLTPVELFDELEQAIITAEANRRWWHGRHRTVVWFSAPSIRIGDHEWLSQHHYTPAYGYDLDQARQMRDALLPILGARLSALTQTAADLHAHLRPPPSRR